MTKQKHILSFSMTPYFLLSYLMAGYSPRQAQTVAICSAMRSSVLCRAWA